MRVTRSLIIATLLSVAAITQTTLFGLLQVAPPDLVLLAVILLAWTRTRPEMVLVTAFAAGLLVDLLGSSLLGLRAVVFAIVAYAGLRTRERAEIGRLAAAIWTGILTLLGVVVLVLLGAVFGQTSLLGPDFATRLIVVPLVNTFLTGLLGPGVVRMIDGDTTAFRFS